MAIEKKEKPLTEKQERFVENYVTDPLQNAGRAIKRAGYNPKNNSVAAQMGAHMLRDPRIQKRIAEIGSRAMEEVKDEHGVTLTVKRIIQRLWEEATDFSVNASASSRVRASELLGKYRQIFTEKISIEGLIESEVKQLSDDEIIGRLKDRIMSDEKVTDLIKVLILSDEELIKFFTERLKREGVLIGNTDHS